MIISKYSGSTVGYVDYYAAAQKRVNRYSKVAPVARVKRDGYVADKAEYEYWNFCTRLSGRAIDKGKCAAQQKLCREVVLYTRWGFYKLGCETGSIVDIRI